MIVDAKGREVEGNGVDLTERQRRKIMAQNATIEDVNTIAHQHAQNAMNHLGNQIGPFVVKAISDAIKGYHESLIERGIIPEQGPLGAALSKEDVEKLISRPITQPEPEAVQ